MTGDAVTRRASYGPKSPVVGERGTRTRRQIVDVTLDLFATWGFHATSVDDIARAAGISRATLYQYFESKDQIFVELMEECGSALLRVVRRLGPLGPTAEGFDNLHWWLGEWAWVYDKYATMFVQWAHIDSSEAALGEMVTRFSDAYADRISVRLESSGVRTADLRNTSSALAALVHRVNYLRHVGENRGLTDEMVVDSLAVVVQLALFPGTPAEILAAHGLQASDTDLRSLGRPPKHPVPTAGRFDHLSVRARRTVDHLLDAASRAFAARGYSSANIDVVVTEAGVARGTFYKYFQDKLDLLTALSEEATGQLGESAERFADIRPGEGAANQLRSWLAEFLPIEQRYAGVLRAWVERQPDDPTVRALGYQVGASLVDALGAVLAQVKRAYPLSPEVAALVLIALLERVPDELAAGSRPASGEAIVETLAEFIERGLLAGEPMA
ncbi:TetR/AcrR family transcriptional regulator [Streptomyces sp. NPDC048254]|uniref:TetR/AcrR family transcriptional regulator n=1 Tax=Streptomyces sp. NPDC048254 TaxID=3365525 RepID=UPI0037139F7C